MLKLLYLLPCLIIFSCTRDSFEPLEEGRMPYYLLVKVETEEDLKPLKVEAAVSIRKYGPYRVTNIYLGQDFKQTLLLVRKFGSEREGKRLVKALRRKPMFRELEMKIVSQPNYQEMLKQRTFYAVY